MLVLEFYIFLRFFLLKKDISNAVYFNASIPIDV